MPDTKKKAGQPKKKSSGTSKASVKKAPAKKAPAKKAVSKSAQKKAPVKKSKVSPRYFLYYFYLEQCPFCVAFDEVWDSIDDDLPSRVNTKKVNVSAEPPARRLKRDSAALAHMGDTVPSIVLVDARSREPRVLRFGNERTKDRLVAWVDLHTSDRTSELKTIKELEQLTKEK